MKKKLNVKLLVRLALLMSIMLMLNLTHLGYLPVGPVFATTMHIPVLIGAVLFGPLAGGILGLFFGLTSWIQALQGVQGVTAFLFMNPLISIVPRVLFGVVAGYFSIFLSKMKEKGRYIFAVVFWAVVLILMVGYVFYVFKVGKGILSAILLLVFLIIVGGFTLIYQKGKNINISFSAGIGAILNTIVVMGLIYLIYGKQYMLAIGLSPDQALATVIGICLTNGIPEALVAVAITTPIGVALKNRGFIS